MDFFILPKALICLFLTLHSPTSLIFQEPIDYVSVGKEGDFLLQRSNNQKILVIQPLKPITETAMVILTRNNHYHFNIRPSDKDDKAHTLVYVYEGNINKKFVKSLESKEFRILEGDSSILIQNKSKEAIEVNGEKVKREGYFSKGIPIFIGGRRVLY